MNSFKEEAHQKATGLLFKKIEELKVGINSINEALSSNTKSSAGDKHETSRAHAQIELEQLSKQLELVERQLDLVRSVDLSTSKTIRSGSLVELPNGWFFLAVSLGKIELENGQIVFCMSPASPLAQQLLGKEKGQMIELNGKKLEILEVL